MISKLATITMAKVSYLLDAICINRMSIVHVAAEERCRELQTTKPCLMQLSFLFYR
jgi:hypothetical protein